MLTTLKGLRITTATGTDRIGLNSVLRLRANAPTTKLSTGIRLLRLVRNIIRLTGDGDTITTALPIGILNLTGIAIQIGIVRPTRFSTVNGPTLTGTSPLKTGHVCIHATRIHALVSLGLPILANIANLAGTILKLINALAPALGDLLDLGLTTAVGSTLYLLNTNYRRLSPQLLPAPRVSVDLSTNNTIDCIASFDYPINDNKDGDLATHAIASLTSLGINGVSTARTFSSSTTPAIAPLPLVSLNV